MNKIFFILFYSFLLISNAQEANFIQFNKKDGLPSSETYSSYNDSKGYIWFATDAGVSKYDGSTFKNYSANEGLLDNVIFNLHEDSKGRLWLISFSGQLFYHFNDSIYSIPANKLLKDNYKSYPHSFHIDEDETIWLGYKNNSTILKIEDYSTISEIPTSIKNQITILELDSLHFVYTASRSFTDTMHIEILSPKGSEQITIKEGFNPTNPNHDLLKYSNGYLLGFSKKLIHFNKNGLINQSNFDFSITKSLYLDTKTSGLIGTDGGGVYSFDIKDLNLLNDAILPNHSITSINKDIEHGRWFTTLNKGVFYSPYSAVKSYSNISLIANKEINAITADKNGIWLGLDNGDILLLSHDTLKRKVEKIANVEPRVLAFLEHKRVEYISILHDSMSRVNKNREIVRLGNKQRAYSIFERSATERLYGTVIGFRILRYDSIIYESRSHGFTKNVRSILEYNNTIWLGCLDGLWSFTNDTYHFHGKESHLLASRINDLKVINDKLVLASNTHGLLIYDPNTKELNAISEKEGLTSNLCKKILIDGDSIFWVSTNRGIDQIKILTKSKIDCKLVTQLGLSTLENYQINDICLWGNEIYMATVNGLFSFSKNKLKNFSIPTPIIFQEFKVNNTRIRTDSLLPTLAHHQNNISLKYHAISYSSGKDISYKYKMEGLNENWQFTKLNQLEFINLSHGSYTFIAYAKGKEGIWSKNPITVKFKINPAIWQRSWFRISLFLIVFIIIVSTFYFQNQRIKKDRDYKILTANIEHKEKELTSFSLNSTQKNILLSDILSKIEHLKEKSSRKKEINEIINLLKSNIHTERDWENFKFQFDQLHRGFIKNLSNSYPSLSNNELRLCCYIRINLLTKEISNLLNISPASVNTSRYRIRKKLNLDASQELNHFLLSF